MSMSAAQIQLLQAARRGAHLDDGAWRLLLRNVGGLRGERPSSKDLGNQTFEAVMASCEQMGFRDKKRGPTFWRDKVYGRAGLANSQTVYVIRQQAKDCRYDLAAMCLRHSRGRTNDVEKLAPDEARAIIEMFKDVRRREANERHRGPHMRTGYLFDPQRIDDGATNAAADPDQTHEDHAPAAQAIGP